MLAPEASQELILGEQKISSATTFRFGHRVAHATRVDLTVLLVVVRKNTIGRDGVVKTSKGGVTARRAKLLVKLLGHGTASVTLKYESSNGGHRTTFDSHQTELHLQHDVLHGIIRCDTSDLVRNCGASNLLSVTLDREGLHGICGVKRMKVARGDPTLTLELAGVHHNTRDTENTRATGEMCRDLTLGSSLEFIVFFFFSSLLLSLEFLLKLLLAFLELAFFLSLNLAKLHLSSFPRLHHTFSLSSISRSIKRGPHFFSFVIFVALFRLNIVNNGRVFKFIARTIIKSGKVIISPHRRRVELTRILRNSRGSFVLVL
mmetsp:Transcript_17740/g.34981  ORF Transcript_17740/g.34981 Transcript_17740/m.34981 type:complete len:318 (+) Transcript_17740:446-1399(+)